ncbi:MAG: phosphoadenylylsulfate reductase [Gammaproteobacteria bacterium RIFCSPLOWO2_02_FULL_56_15]|nr:MAG: phosphoadenylylsulfate reductase [Gammaproteobacteria bacterium RIFCSPLOWO2_02_FULL_56_15]
MDHRNVSLDELQVLGNKELADKTPSEIIQWTVDQNKAAIVSTSFGPFSAVMLHAATRVKADIPVIWVDSGYNTWETYVYAEKLIKDLQLNIQVFIPQMSAARRDAVMKGIPAVSSDLHPEFTRQVKLEPFQRALDAFKPDFWITAIRKDETDFRKTLDIISKGPNGILKVAPFLQWTEVDMEAYLYEHSLPQVENYFDPTKVASDRECGLHTTDYSI